MNRSFSKIRHIQEANQKLESRLIKEQDDNRVDYANPNTTYASKPDMRQDFRAQRQQLRQDQRAVRQNTRQNARFARRNDRAENAAIAEIKNLTTDLNTLVSSINTIGSTHKDTDAYKAFYDVLSNITTAINSYVQAASNPEATIEEYQNKNATQYTEQ